MTVFDTKVFGFLWYAYPTAEQTEKHTAMGRNAQFMSFLEFPNSWGSCVFL